MTRTNAEIAEMYMLEQMSIEGNHALSSRQKNVLSAEVRRRFEREAIKEREAKDKE